MNKKTKSSIILSSLASIAVACSLIVGSTYALFTSESETNIAVTSGKVNVVASIEDFEAYSPKLIASDASSILEKDNIATKLEDNSYVFGNGGTVSINEGVFTLDKMTPGDKVNFSVHILNNGNVHTKYRTTIRYVEDDGLYDVLNIAVGSEKLLFNEDKVSYFAWKEFLAEGDASDIPLSIELPIETGNEYQGKTTKILVNVEAIQSNAQTIDDENSILYLSSSLDHEYFQKILSSKSLNKNVVKIVYRNQVSEEDSKISQLIPQTYINDDSILNLSNKIISVDASNSSTYGNASPALMQVQNGATLTINDEDNSGTITCEEPNANQIYGINVNGGKVVVNGGNFYGAMSALQVKKGELEINGGFFDLAPTCKSIVPSYAKYVINCIDAQFKDGTAKVSIKGGTFVNFDPSANPEGKGTTYVADGYKVVSETHGSETWYTVVEDGE